MAFCEPAEAVGLLPEDLQEGDLKGKALPAAKASQESSVGACSPFECKPAASSQRSAGTVSGGVPEVAQPCAAVSASTSLKRPLSSAELEGLELDQDSQTSSQGCSKSQRSSREATPARRRAAEQPGWEGEEQGSGDEASDLDSGSGLDFLLRACEMLDPHGAARAAACAASLPTPVKRQPGAGDGTPKPACLARAAGSASLDASPVAAVRRPVSRRLLARGSGDQDGDYVPEADSDYEGSRGHVDADYMPSGRTARASTRALRASARGAAAAVASAVAATSSDEVEAPAPPAPAPTGRGRWGGEPKALITGPCMNPDCEHPFESPQWRKGPPQHPVLCNACGTRWLRNGTLKPLVPRRGLRYKNKPKPGKGKAAAALPLSVPTPAQLAGVTLPAQSSDASGEGRPGSQGEDAAALFSQSQQGSLQLPIPPLQAAVPSFMPPMAFSPAALFGSLDPAAAAAAAAAAFQAAPHMFAAGCPGPVAAPPVLTPWGFFAPVAQPPALFQPAPAQHAEQQCVAVKHEVAAQAEPEQQLSAGSETQSVAVA